MKSAKPSIYEKVTDTIIAALEAGTVPWRKPWTTSAPKNLFTGKEYRGSNNFLLGMAPTKHPFFATFNQVRDAGGTILKGSKSLPVFFFAPMNGKTTENDAGEEVSGRSYWVAKQYNVFTVEQMELPAAVMEKLLVSEHVNTYEFNASEVIDGYLLNEGIKTVPSINSAYYSPSEDHIGMPAIESFLGTHEYYATFFHEIGHSTGAAKRLNRDGIIKPSPRHARGAVYGFEELVAELTAAFLCQKTGRFNDDLPVEQRAAYIQSWLKVLNDDKTMVYKAASQAQKAADFVIEKCGVKIESTEDVA